MSIIFCTSCTHPIDPQEEDYYTHPDSLKSYCEDCYDQSPMHCENEFDRSNECRCGEHVIMPAEPDVGIMNNYLELK